MAPAAKRLSTRFSPRIEDKITRTWQDDPARNADPIQDLSISMSVRLAAVLVFVAWSSALSVADISGIVSDEHGARIVGAQIELVGTSATQSQVTNDRGEFHFVAQENEQLILRIQSAGFAAYENKFSGDSANISVTLRPERARETVVVSSTRTALSEQENPADVDTIRAPALASTAAPLLDDALRQSLGFSLFRRSDSRVANPTSQGVSLRGVGGSGASRAVVLRDGVPLNDPFGGWVQWDRVPNASLDSVELARGGLSDLYGANALSGAIELNPRRPSASAATMEVSGGNSVQPDVSIFAGTQLGSWQTSGSVENMHSPGYILVSDSDRGAVDRTAGLDFTTANLLVGRSFSSNAHVFVEGSIFAENRNNGTVIQTNSTHLSQLVAGAELGNSRTGTFQLRAYGSGERFHQFFSSLAADRNSESLIRYQTVPSTSVGGSAQWDRVTQGRHHVVAGFDGRMVKGITEETAFVAAACGSACPGNVVANSLVNAGGRTNLYGFFLEDFVRITPRLVLSGAVRGDVWNDIDGLTFTQSLVRPTNSRTAFPDRNQSAVSPRVAARYAVTGNVALSASGYRSFRAPTLNELYRSFRLGNILTNANPALTAECLTGGEAGINVNVRSLKLKALFFQADVDDPVTNQTLSVTPALITRQRANLGTDRARGLEFQAERQWRDFFFSSGYQWTSSVVTSNAAQPSLVGLFIAEVPRHQFTTELRYARGGWTLGVQARGSSKQFDDDLNTLVLPAYGNLDIFGSRRVLKHAEFFVAVEDLTNTRYMVARTPVPTYGPPTLARAGIRINAGGSR